MTGRKLKSQCLSVPEKTVLVTCFKHTQLVGHAFATVWSYDGGLLSDVRIRNVTDYISRCCWVGYPASS